VSPVDDEGGVIDNDDTNGYGESSSRNTSNAWVPEIRITDTAVAAPKEEDAPPPPDDSAYIVSSSLIVSGLLSIVVV
jgi:hypothetical protein